MIIIITKGKFDARELYRHQKFGQPVQPAQNQQNIPPQKPVLAPMNLASNSAVERDKVDNSLLDPFDDVDDAVFAKMAADMEYDRVVFDENPRLPEFKFDPR